jgi:hypothetical protein
VIKNSLNIALVMTELRRLKMTSQEREKLLDRIEYVYLEHSGGISDGLKEILTYIIHILREDKK